MEYLEINKIVAIRLYIWVLIFMPRFTLEIILVLVFIASWLLSFYLCPIDFISEYGVSLYINIAVLSATLVGFLIVVHQLVINMMTMDTLLSRFLRKNEDARDYILGLLRYIALTIIALLFSIVISISSIWFNWIENKYIISTLFANIITAFVLLFLITVNILDMHNYMIELEGKVNK